MISRNFSLCILMACLPLVAPAQSAPPLPPAASAPAATRAADPSLFGDLGGLPVIRQVVNDFVAIMLADERIGFTFKDTNLPRLHEKLVEQFCLLSGGGCIYTGDPMKEVHQGLKLTNAHFNALVEDLQLAMDRSGIASRTQNRLLALLAPMQRDTVTR
ncbi:group 1 truncated hemoglobin [Herbaspirillum sp. YR522]|uniref:group I truncated hemoglobin n=1 Tax=Herbaspirillum sp. YR522 TaxID=1144342 RepID=UPI00026F7F83|nr:group 1 truncated hemoglobin [Herbaspirillum sp. YR522]EJN06913.1 hemoglobin like protein [Herbaspirillum sp. YR522]